jgi:hypothetical protein
MLLILAQPNENVINPLWYKLYQVIALLPSILRWRMVQSTLHDDAYVVLIAFLVELRKRRGVTQEELGRSLNKPQSFISKVERRERRLDIVEFTAWVNGIGADPLRAYADLLGKLESR